MEHQPTSKVKYWAHKLAVKSEPGLTTGQLMLINEDLKPGMLFPLSFGLVELLSEHGHSGARTAEVGSLELCRFLDC
jgi:hypothetical protein